MRDFVLSLLLRRFCMLVFFLFVSLVVILLLTDKSLQATSWPIAKKRERHGDRERKKKDSFVCFFFFFIRSFLCLLLRRSRHWVGADLDMHGGFLAPRLFLGLQFVSSFFLFFSRCTERRRVHQELYLIQVSSCLQGDEEIDQ